MRTLCIASLACGLALPVSALAWPPALQLQYALDGRDLGLPLHGDGSLNWAPQDGRYQVELSGSALIGASYRSEGRIDADWLQPERYTQRLFLRSASVVFDRAHGLLQFSSGAPAQALTPTMQDSASVFIQLAQQISTRQDWKPGQSLEFDLARPSGVVHWRFVLLDQPWLQTGMGPLQCWHLQVRTPQGQAGDEVWLAPRLHDLPARIRLQQGNDFLLFQLRGASRPLEAPASAPNSAA